MKVGGPSSVGPVSGPAGRSASAASGFSLGGGVAAPTTAHPTAAASSVAGLDALLMLQEPEDSIARRRRAVRRAEGLLDRLDALRLAALGEGEPEDALQRLAQAVRERRADVDDAGLGEALDAVETRAAVELAKREVRGG
jgi:hypothetical protein